MKFFLLALLIPISISADDHLDTKSIAECAWHPYGLSKGTEDALLLEGEQKEQALTKRGKLVNGQINEAFKGFICSAVNREEIGQYAQTIDAVRTETMSSFLDDFSPAEFAYFVDCGDQQNPFYKNFHPEDIYYTADGLSNTTVNLIKDMGPLLLEKGPNGKTPLEQVANQIEFAQEISSPKEGVYSQIQSRIEIALSNLDKAETQCAERLLPSPPTELTTTSPSSATDQIQNNLVEQFADELLVLLRTGADVQEFEPLFDDVVSGSRSSGKDKADFLKNLQELMRDQPAFSSYRVLDAATMVEEIFELSKIDQAVFGQYVSDEVFNDDLFESDFRNFVSVVNEGGCMLLYNVTDNVGNSGWIAIGVGHDHQFSPKVFVATGLGDFK